MVSKHVTAVPHHATPYGVAHRGLCRSALLALLILPWNVGAQVGPGVLDVRAPQQSMHLYAPGFRPLRYQEAPRDTLASSGRLFATAAGVGLLGYVVGGGVFYYACGSAAPTSSCFGQLALGMSVPIAAVGVTAYGLGADTDRAVLGSVLGGAIGLAVFAVDLDQPLISLGLATVAHAAVTTLAARIHFRRRSRQ